RGRGRAVAVVVGPVVVVAGGVAPAPVGGGERRQAVGDAGAVALRAGRAEFPGGIHLAADRGPVGMDAAARIHADLRIQRRAADRRGVGALHAERSEERRVGREWSSGWAREKSKRETRAT